MKIWFDMDGTLADLYGVENWLEMLTAHDATPYTVARPLVNMATLARMIHKRQALGFKVCVLSALAKNSNPDYDAAVIAAKRKWLAKHLPSVTFDEIRFVPYDFIKNNANSGADILFDDEARHLTAWTGTAYHAQNLIENLKKVVA